MDLKRTWTLNGIILVVMSVTACTPLEKLGWITTGFKNHSNYLIPIAAVLVLNIASVFLFKSREIRSIKISFFLTTVSGVGSYASNQAKISSLQIALSILSVITISFTLTFIARYFLEQRIIHDMSDPVDQETSVTSRIRHMSTQLILLFALIFAVGLAISQMIWRNA